MVNRFNLFSSFQLLKCEDLLPFFAIYDCWTVGWTKVATDDVALGFLGTFYRLKKCINRVYFGGLIDSKIIIGSSPSGSLISGNRSTLRLCQGKWQLLSSLISVSFGAMSA